MEKSETVIFKANFLVRHRVLQTIEDAMCDFPRMMVHVTERPATFSTEFNVEMHGSAADIEAFRRLVIGPLLM